MSSHPVVVSPLLAAMADGIGDLVLASSQWVDACRETLSHLVDRHRSVLGDLGSFTLCEVAHNPPAYLRCGKTLAWQAKFNGATVQVQVGALAPSDCDLYIEGDHSIMSNLGRIQYSHRDPALVEVAQERLRKLSRWVVHGAMPVHPGLSVVLRALHDALAVRTMPRYVWMTPEWVSSARYILTTRADSTKYADDLLEVEFTFAEEFTNTPRYAFPNGTHGGFWVRCQRGQLTVGAGPLPKQFEPADMLTHGAYTPVVPVGRTVNAAMTDDDKAAQAAYSKSAFRFDKDVGAAPVKQTSPSGRAPMPAALGKVFLPLHDELSKRTSGDLPADYDPTVKAEWASPRSFDRQLSYDPTWLRYDKVDIYGSPRR